MISDFARGQVSANGDAVLLVSTHKGAAHFVPAIRATLAQSWPNHPHLRFVTDGGATGDDVLRANTSAYVPLMLEALSAVRLQFPDATHIFHMLEDHCPLRACDHVHILQTLRLCVRNQLASVCFVTYEWPWSASKVDLVDYAERLGLPHVDTVEMDGIRLGVVPKTFFRYFQVQPAIWRIDYLEKTLRSAVAANVIDPWAFEAFRWDGAEQHYVSQYPWPTVHHGFLVKGNVNLTAIDFADRHLAKDLRRVLRLDAQRAMGGIRYTLRHIKRAFLRRLSR